MPRKLEDLVAALEDLTPLRRAEDWDNVGLLLDQARPKAIARVLLTIDLTPAVLEEAVSGRAGLVVAYHPPIFAGLKRLARARTRERVLLEAIAANLAIWSPHTALDAAPDGVNDWLCEGLPAADVAPLTPHLVEDRTQACKVVVFAPRDVAASLRDAMAAAGAGRIGDYESCAFAIPGTGSFRGLDGTDPAVGKAGRLEEVEELRLEMVAARADLSAIASAIRRVHPYEEPAWEVVPLAARPEPGAGAARRATLRTPVALERIARGLKKHLGVERLRVAAAPRHEAGEPVVSAAVCAGAGGSVLKDARADLLVTGEMRHHDVLAALERGVSVVLCEHTNTERGYLPRYAERLRAAFGKGVEVAVSKADREPLRII